jgi:hypothetical protein
VNLHKDVWDFYNLLELHYGVRGLDVDDQGRLRTENDKVVNHGICCRNGITEALLTHQIPNM